MSNVLLVPHQETYFQSYSNFPDIRWHMLVTGFGGGKTRANVILTLKLCKELQGMKDRAGDHARIIVAGYTITHLEKTFLLYFRSYLNGSKTKWREDTKNHIAYVGDVTVMFLPMENPDDLFGEDACACIQEESDELPEATLIAACKALSERTRQQIVGFRSPFIALGTTSQGQSGLYRLYCQFIKQGTAFVLIRGRTQDNFYLPKEQVIDLYKLYDETERRVFLNGEFLMVNKGRVFPGFDWARNYIDDDLDLHLRTNERVYISQDFNTGYSRATAWVAREGVCHAVKSYDFPDIADAPDVFRHDFPTQDIFWIPDVTTKDSYPQFARALRRNSIHIIHRSKNPLVEDTAFLVSVMCKAGRIIFHKMARESADAVARAARDKDGKIGKGKAPSDWQHYGDTVRYAVSYMALVLPEFKDIRRSLITHIASLRKEVEETDERPVKKLAAGYTQIEASAYLK